MQDAKEEVRARLNIEDVIGEYVQLKRAGRSFKGLSPFSGEKTPSFFVSPEKNIWHDFSSNKGGDIFAFVMEAEGMDFRQALEHLARKAGIDLSLYENKSSQELTRRKKRLFEANQRAAQFYQRNLLGNQHALEYVFQQRGLNKAVVGDFLIGYAPDTGDALRSYLTKQGFSRKELADAGLTNRYGGDMFRGRMIVPLMDATGQVIGFTGRIIGDVPNAPKYLNTSQTLLYDKGRHIFALSQAKEAIRSKGYAVIVEGNLDVVSSHQADVKQVVATAGTAMTEHHLRALKRLTPDVRLAFDGDKAGIAATERAIGIASEVGVELTIVSLPEGAKDPDELIRQSPTLWQEAIDARKPAVDWVIEQYAERVDLATASGKRAFTTAALQIISLLHDPVEKEHYEQLVARMTHSSLEAIRQKSSQHTVGEKELREVRTHATVNNPSDDRFLALDDALAIAALDPASQELFAEFDDSIIDDEARRGLVSYFAAHHTKPLETVPDGLQLYDKYVTMVLLRADKRIADRKDRDIYATAALIRKFEEEHSKHQTIVLAKQLDQAIERGDREAVTLLGEKIKKLQKENLRGRR